MLSRLVAAVVSFFADALRPADPLAQLTDRELGKPTDATRCEVFRAARAYRTAPQDRTRAPRPVSLMPRRTA